MRFVSPETVRIDLGNGDWITVKKELNVGEEKRFRSSGLRRAHDKGSVDIDWSAMALARVEAYLVAWSACDKDGKPVAVDRSALEALSVEDFDAIDAAIQRHMAEVAAEKKARSMTPTSTAA